MELTCYPCTQSLCLPQVSASSVQSLHSFLDKSIFKGGKEMFQFCLPLVSERSFRNKCSLVTTFYHRKFLGEREPESENIGTLKDLF